MSEKKVTFEFDDSADEIINQVNKALKASSVGAKFKYVGTEDDERFIYTLITDDKTAT